MAIKENVAIMIQQYKVKNQLSLLGLSEELGVAASSLQCYLKGDSNLRADTIEMLANKMRVSVTEMVSGPAPGREQAEIALWAAKELGSLPQEQRLKGIRLFLELVALFAKSA